MDYTTLIVPVMFMLYDCHKPHWHGAVVHLQKSYTIHYSTSLMKKLFSQDYPYDFSLDPKLAFVT